MTSKNEWDCYDQLINQLSTLRILFLDEHHQLYTKIILKKKLPWNYHLKVLVRVNLVFKKLYIF
jgi:hypothetical protein